MLYIVEGRTGEHEDRSTWLVSGARDEGEAFGLCERLNRWCEENGYDRYDEARPWIDATRPSDPKPDEDPKFRCDYNGTKYRVVAVPEIAS